MVFFGTSFFVLEIYTFLYCANEGSDDVVDRSTNAITRIFLIYLKFNISPVCLLVLGICVRLTNTCVPLNPKQGLLASRSSALNLLNSRMNSSEPYTFETLAVSKPQENVVQVELNRPEKRNAMNKTFWR